MNDKISGNFNLYPGEKIILNKGNNYMSKVYDKAGHNEIAWSQRLNVPVEFLLAK